MPVSVLAGEKPHATARRKSPSACPIPSQVADAEHVPVRRERLQWDGHYVPPGKPATPVAMRKKPISDTDYGRRNEPAPAVEFQEARVHPIRLLDKVRPLAARARNQRREQHGLPSH